TSLTANQSGISGGHYYVNGNHTLSGRTVTVGVNAARTLTLQGAGTFYITGVGLQVGNLLLQEGSGDYTIDVENSPTTRYLIASALGSAAQQQQRDNTLTLHQYRETGDLIIQGGGIGGTRLVTSGPG